MPSDTPITPVSERPPETTAPAPDTAADDQALRSVALIVTADCRNEAEKYLEEVRVAVGGE